MRRSPVIFRAPSKKCNIVYNCLCHKSLLDQIFIRRMSASFAQFLMILICNQRTVYIYRYFPSKCFINLLYFGEDKILISTDNMCNLHQMIINYICKIICRISVRFDQDHIVQLCIRLCDISVNLIMECCLPSVGIFRRITYGFPAARFASTSSLLRCRQCLSYTRFLPLPETLSLKTPDVLCHRNSNKHLPVQYKLLCIFQIKS